MEKRRCKFKIGMTVYPRTTRQGYLKSSKISENTKLIITAIKEDAEHNPIYVCGYHNYEYREDELSRKKWKDLG